MNRLPERAWYGRKNSVALCGVTAIRAMRSDFSNQCGSRFRLHRSIINSAPIDTLCASMIRRFSNPDIFVVVRINRDRADGLDRLFVKNRAISRSAPFIGFPTPPLAAPTNSVIFPGRFLRPVIAEMRPLIGPADVARAQAGNGGGTKLSLLRARIRGGKTNRAN